MNRVESEVGEAGDLKGMLISSVSIFFTVLYVLIFVRVILSWIPVNARANPILAIVYTVTDPILNPIKRMLQKSPLGGRGMPLDFSPIFALFLLQMGKVVAISLIQAF